MAQQSTASGVARRNVVDAPREVRKGVNRSVTGLTVNPKRIAEPSISALTGYVPTTVNFFSPMDCAHIVVKKTGRSTTKTNQNFGKA